MDEELEMTGGAPVAQPAETESAQPAAEPEYPNRKAFSDRFSKRHKDIDFEDKEARYQALSDDDDRLGRYEESGKALSDVFEKHRWMASMLEDLRENDDLDPISWMADNGIDISEALEDEEYRKEISDRIAAYQENQLKGEQAATEREQNLEKSADALEGLGVGEDEFNDLWNYFFNDVVAPVLRGEVSKETWEMVRKARNYDSDIENASKQGEMKARNEKIRNKVKDNVGSDVPPALSQGGSASAKPQPKKKKNGFFDDIIQ
jgi:hypothetical protein